MICIAHVFRFLRFLEMKLFLRKFGASVLASHKVDIERVDVAVTI
jgi:hypothetical protein